MATARIKGAVARPSFSAELHCHCSRSTGNDHDSDRLDNGNGFSSLQSGRFLHVHPSPSAFFAGELRLSGGSRFWEELGFGRRSRNRICRQSRTFSAFPPLQPSVSSPDRGPVVSRFRNGSAGGDPDNGTMHNNIGNQKQKEAKSRISSINSSGTSSSRRRVRCQVAASDASPEHITETSHASEGRRRVDSPPLGPRIFRRRRVVCRVAAKEAPPPLSRQSIPPVEEEVPARCEKAPELPKYSAPAFPRRLPSQLQYDEGVLGGISAYTRGVGRLDLGADTLTYLKKILTSRVYDVAVESPLERANKVSDRVGSDIFLKREDLQKVFSFKLRGAYNMMAQLPPDALERGVICSSAGNHAQGVALAAAQLGCSAIICMPVTTPAIKWNSVKRLGATVVLVGEAYDETQAYAKQRALEEGRVFVPPFDHPDVIAGQGTVGMEILRQHPGPIHAIFVPVGGGGLIAGIAAYVKCLRPEVKIIGVEPADANAMALSLHEGQRICLDKVGGFADGVAVKMVGEETFRICRELIDGVVLVSKDAICAAIKDVFEETRCILEPAGALALAGAKAYCKYNDDSQKGGSANGGAPGSMVVITSGANMNFDRLRVVAELAEVGERREAVLATSIPERPGTFKEFCRLVGSDINISEFKYRRADNSSAHVFYSVNVGTNEELAKLMERMKEAEFPTIDMSSNDLAKTHLRHLVGGRNSVEDEVLYRFEFPERPGALLRFLDFISPRWDITLFHYRAEGERVGNVLVGLQIPPAEEAQFRSAADALGYQYVSEGNNEAFRMFLR